MPPTRRTTGPPRVAGRPPPMHRRRRTTAASNPVLVAAGRGRREPARTGQRRAGPSHAARLRRRSAARPASWDPASGHRGRRAARSAWAGRPRARSQSAMTGRLRASPEIRRAVRSSVSASVHSLGVVGGNPDCFADRGDAGRSGPGGAGMRERAPRVGVENSAAMTRCAPTASASALLSGRNSARTARSSTEVSTPVGSGGSSSRGGFGRCARRACAAALGESALRRSGTALPRPAASRSPRRGGFPPPGRRAGAVAPGAPARPLTSAATVCTSHNCAGQRTRAARRTERPSSKVVSGDVLLSHAVARAVPSALRGLASGFGMGPGVSLSLWSPKLYGDVVRTAASWAA